MAQTVMTKTLLPAINSVGTANATNLGLITMNACDATNGNSITSTGTEVLIVINSTGGALTFAMTGVADQQGRTANYSVSVPATTIGAASTTSIVATPRLSQTLWSNGGQIFLPSSNNAGLYVGILYGY